MTEDPSDGLRGGQALIAALEDIQATDVSPERLGTFTNEDDYNALCVELLVEVGQYVIVAASVLPGESRRWDRDQAILGGHLVRLYKLISALLDQICQRRREITFIIARVTFECVVNLRFLIQNAGTPDVFNSYIAYSLKQEKRLYNRIKKNIEQRAGEVLPIETRMLNSVARTLKASGVTIEALSTSQPKEWGDRNLYQRTEALGLEEMYLGTFGGPSASVHGNWMDLLGMHLDGGDSGEGFTPSATWSRPRPQIGDTIALLAVEAVQDYFHYLFGDDLVFEVLDGLFDRIRQAMHSHEEFLMRSGAISTDRASSDA